MITLMLIIKINEDYDDDDGVVDVDGIDKKRSM